MVAGGGIPLNSGRKMVLLSATLGGMGQDKNEMNLVLI